MEIVSLKNRVITGVFWLAATKAVGQAITWVITIYVMRLLAPHDYGLMGMATLVMSFLFLFNEFGLGVAMVQRANLTPLQASNLAWAILGLNSVLFLMLLLGAPLFAVYFREPAVTNIVRALSVTFILSGIGAPRGYLLNREMAFKKTSRAELAGNLAGAGITLTLAYLGYGVWSLVTGHLGQVLITNTLYLMYSPLRLRPHFVLSDVKSSINFGFQVAGSRLLWYISANADFMVVGRVLGTAALGYYNLAFQLASLPIDKGVSIVTQVAFPLFSMNQHDNAAVRRHFLKMAGIVALLTCPLFFGLFAVAEVAVQVFLTSAWTAAILPLKILCLVSWLRGVTSLNSQLLVAKGQPRIVLANFLLQAIVMPIAFYLGSRYNLTGVSAAWVVVWPLLAALMTWQTLRVIELDLSAYVGALKHPVIGSVVMALAVSIVQLQLPADAAVTRLAVSVVLGAVIYVAYILAFDKVALHDARDIVRAARAGRRLAPAAVEATA